jgi:hypothetical protein
MLSECISLGPAVVADDIDEIVADERWVVEILEYVSVDVSESAVRAVFVPEAEMSCPIRLCANFDQIRC